MSHMGGYYESYGGIMSHYVHKVIISCRIMVNVMEIFAATLKTVKTP